MGSREDQREQFDQREHARLNAEWSGGDDERLRAGLQTGLVGLFTFAAAMLAFLLLKL
jgi:hypothetical protein